MSKNSVVLQNEKFRISRVVEVDGDKTELLVDFVFDNRNGTFRISPKITTKHVSRDAVIRQALRTQLTAMEDEAIEACLDLKTKWQMANGDSDPLQGELFSKPKARYEAKADAAMFDNHGVKWNEETWRYEYPNGEPWNATDEDEGGGSDDGQEPGSVQLTIAASKTRKQKAG